MIPLLVRRFERISDLTCDWYCIIERDLRLRHAAS